MNKTLLFTILIGAAAIAGVLYTAQNKTGSFLQSGYQYENDFQQFSAKFQKQYAHDEVFYRYKKFADNMEIIKAHNTLYAAGKFTYFLGVNQLADMDIAEYKQKLLKFKPKQRQIFQSVKVNVGAVSSSIDWVTKGAVTSIKNQGQCGGCWAFSAVGALEGLYFIKKGNLIGLSEQCLIDCSGSYGNYGCNGGSIDNAFKYVAEHGIPSEEGYPYSSKDGTCKPYTPVFQTTGYQDVTANSESALINAISQQPVSVAIEADTSAFQLYSGGILNNSACGTNLDHAVLAVGYGSDYLKLKNSWGTSWGEQGYIRIARLGDGPGQCGVNQMASYPTD